MYTTRITLGNGAYGNLSYHNCGKPGCWVDICPNPRDDEKIKLNRHLFMNKKAGGGGEGSGAQKSNTKNNGVNLKTERKERDR
jgi:hypothetical protein